MKNLIPMIFLTGALLVGCAGPRPFTMTCSTIGASAVVEPGQPIGLGDFSVAAPEGRDWCLAHRGPNRVVFVTSPFMGQYIEKPKPSLAWNSIGMVAYRVKHGAASLKNTDELRQFVEEWIKRGFGVNASGSELIVGDMAEPRFALVRSSVRVTRFLDADCVRYEYVMEERDNPHVPDIVLILTDHGVICHHLSAPDYLVWMSLSERYERGNQIDPSLFQKLKSQEAGPFFESLKFAQTG